MTSRENEQNWKRQLTELTAQQDARVAALKSTLTQKRAEAEGRLAQMAENTLMAIQVDGEKRLAAVRAETEEVLAEKRAEWQKKLDEAATEDISDALRSAFTAIVGDRWSTDD